MRRIPAYIVSAADYYRLIDEHFGGEEPWRVSDLDDYILVDGRPYDRSEDE